MSMQRHDDVTASRGNSTRVLGGLTKRISQRVQFSGGNGYSLAAILDIPETQEAIPLVVFSHCFTCNKDLKAIVRLSRYLSERGIAVLRYDMTGLGGSEGKFRETNFSTNVADLQAAIDFAEKQIGPVHFLLGHSLGGAASLAVAGQWSDERKHLCGVATLAAPSDTRHLAELLIRMDSRVQKEGLGEVTIGGRRWETTTQLIDNLKHYDLPAVIAGIQVPVLLFHSPVDETVGYEHALRILSWVGSKGGADGERSEKALSHSAVSVHERSPSNLASLVTLPGADHLLTRDPRDLELIGDMFIAWSGRHWE